MLYNIKELAVPGKLGSRATVCRLIASGELSAVKLGRRTLVPDAALQSFLASLPVVPVRPKPAALK
ncbi:MULTISPECIES: helix-turn-helix domain-containing protein [Acidiphilium]|uniref:helix-turn-helix domain-containing protein n=1 Tax=Acidiphilium TaxID=522 RepID=UPI000BDBF976|nr:MULTISPECIES: helix-turn-helix domain-containing protein [Acidiphilium]OZB23892.1 MAG: hypothetical protein B7X49_15460 [Acidiphilium sp. 34-64-41]HQT86613.1 helix-turn-helix domain-containing protein [Acidiphilium rubrum]